MNSLEKYEENEYEYGSWEKYMDSLKKVEYISTTPTQNWQRCPICEGTGIYQGQGTFSEIPVCPTCNGKRIISTLTGLPPQ